MSRKTPFPMALLINNEYTGEPGHNIPTRYRVHSEDSYQPTHPRNLIRVFAGHSVVAKDPKRHQANSEDSYQPARTRRLI